MCGIWIVKKEKKKKNNKKQKGGQVGGAGGQCCEYVQRWGGTERGGGSIYDKIHHQQHWTAAIGFLICLLVFLFRFLWNDIKDKVIYV